MNDLAVLPGNLQGSLASRYGNLIGLNRLLSSHKQLVDVSKHRSFLFATSIG